jgi:hypothetical protein
MLFASDIIWRKYGFHYSVVFIIIENEIVTAGCAASTVSFIKFLVTEGVCSAEIRRRLSVAFKDNVPSLSGCLNGVRISGEVGSVFLTMSELPSPMKTFAEARSVPYPADM